MERMKNMILWTLETFSGESICEIDYFFNLPILIGEAEMAVEEIENVAEVVEKVATVADKVSTQMADKLHDHTKLQEAAFLVERVSKATAQEAELTINIIHKVTLFNFAQLLNLIYT